MDEPYCETDSELMGRYIVFELVFELLTSSGCLLIVPKNPPRLASVDCRVLSVEVAVEVERWTLNVKA